MSYEEKKLILDGYEEKRKKLAMVIVPTIVVGSVLLAFSNDALILKIISLIALAVGLAMVGLSVSYQKKIDVLYKEYSAELKNALLTPIFAEYLSDCVYDSTKGISRKFIKSTGLTSTGFNTYSSNDRIVGMYKNIKVKRADVVAEHISGNRKHRDVRTYINGQVYVLTFNKEFKGKVQVMHKYTDYVPKTKNAVGERVPKPRVEMENVDFNKVFKVYANNDVEAFYLLTPQIMETMIDACAIKRSVVNFAFTKNKLVINFNTNSDSLRIPFDKMGKEDRNEMLKEARREMEFVVRLIDIFNLENDIFKAEGGFLS